MLYIALVAIYVAAVGWYVISVIVSGNKKNRDGSTSSSGHGGGRSHRSSTPRHKGKRCPSCKQIVDVRRTICQHCSHEFEIEPGVEPHPDDIKSGRRSPTPPNSAGEKASDR
jgi:hypothetical protein